MAVAPLEGIRVIDLSWVWAGPTCTRILSDLGAEVVKIESVQRPDSIRALIPAENEERPDYWEYGGSFAEHNLGKLDVTLNLGHPDGVVLFKRLVAISDIVVESFTPRVMEQFGLAYKALACVKPDIIMLSMSGYGHSGPKKDRVAYGHSLEAECGIASTIGYNGEAPMKSGLAYTDPLSGQMAAGAVLSALWSRAKTGKGCWIDFSELEVGLPFLGGPLMDYQMNGVVPSPIGNSHPSMAPHGAYRCQGPDAWVTVAVRSRKEWQALCQVIGQEEWPDASRFESAEGRRCPEVDEAIACWTGSRSVDEAVRILQAAAVPAARVSNGRELLLDPQLRERRFFQFIEHPLYGHRPFAPRLAAVFERSDVRARGPAPSLGQNNEYVFRHLLGLSDDEYAQLRSIGAIGGEPAAGRPSVSMPLEMLRRQGAIAAIDGDYRALIDSLWAEAAEGEA